MSVSVVDVLHRQHERVAELFGQVSHPDEDRPARLRELLQELAAHVAAERQIASGVDDPDLSGQYRRMEELMILIERRKFNSPDVPDLVNELLSVNESHTRSAESVLFPALRGLSPEEQAELAAQVDREETEMVTHPHPHLNSNELVSATLGKAAVKWDTARDRTVNNRHLEDDHPEPS
jgi:hypothetical protein